MPADRMALVPDGLAEAPGVSVGAPSPFYCTGEDNIRVSSFGSLAGVELSVRSRVLRIDGQIAPSADRHVPNSNRTIATTEHPLTDGWLNGIEIHAIVGTPRVGQVYVVVDIIRGGGAGAVVLQTLLQGYVTDTSRLAWPGSFMRPSAEGPGVLRSITGTDPAANVEVSEAVPTNARWRLVSLDVALVTDANVANREVTLTIDDGALVVAEVCSAVAHAASLTRRYSFTRGVQRGTPAAGTVISAPMPDIQLQGGFRVRTVTTNLQATDNYGAPQLLVEEWIED